MSTIFTIDFDFNLSDQKEALRFLQENGYKLLGFKGATGPNQVTAGMPVWFAEPFGEMFGDVEIDYEPLYKVYVYNKATIGAYTTIQMQALSPEFSLGTAVKFQQDGTFSEIGDALPGTISVLNDRPDGTENVTIGLAAKINGVYQPFCAFMSTPQGSISMAPNEKVCLFAAQTDLTSGSVTAQSTAPGCTFEFNANAVHYDLRVLPSTYGITSTADGLPVTNIGSGDSLLQLLNKK